MNKKLFMVTFLIALAGAVITMTHIATATYTASDFSKFCSQNASTCAKNENPQARTGNISCPAGSQTIDAVYIHAGNGQTVFQLPDSGYTSVYSNNNNTVTVNVNGTGPDHPDLSWIAVVCSVHAKPTVTLTPTETPTVTPTPTIDPCITRSCVTPTATPEASITPNPTNTPTPGTSNNNSDTSSSSGSSNSSNSQQTAVLGASAMAPTGTFQTTVMNILLVFGMMVLGTGFVSYAKEKKI